MTSPFVDRVEYQVIGRDVNASSVFRGVADAADSVGDSITELGSDLDRANRSIEDTVDRMRELLSSLQDLSASRDITITTNVREVLGSIEDNRQIVELLGDRFENLTVNVIATVNQLVELNDGLTTIDDNRTAVITLGDDVLQLTQNIDATVDSVVDLNDGLQTIDDNRTAVITLGDDVLQLTQNIDATVDSVVDLNDGLQTIDDNRTAIVTIDGDFVTLTQDIDATVDSVVSLNEGIQTIDDNRSVIVTVDDDFRRLTQDIDATVDSIVNLNDGITTIDDNRTAITGVGDDFRTLGDDIDNTRLVVIRFNDEVARVDDNRPGVIDLGTGFDDLATAVERSRGRVNDLNRDIDNLPGGRDIDNDIDVSRRVVETVSSDRDRWERAGLVAGAVFGHAVLTTLGSILVSGISKIPFSGAIAAVIQGFASGPLGAAITAVLVGVAASAAGLVANAFSAGILAALGGGVIAVGMIAAFSDPTYKAVLKGVGTQIKDTLQSAVMDSGFTSAMIDALKVVTQGFKDMKPAMEDVFHNAAPLIKPLVEGMMGFAQNVLPGVSVALKNMKPIFDQLGVWLPKLGKTVGEFFAKLSSESPRLASALGYVLGFVNTTIKFIGGVLIGLAKLEPVFEGILKAVKRFWDVIKVIQPGFALIAFLQGLWYWFGVVRDIVDILSPLFKSFSRENDTLSRSVGRLLGPLSRVSGLAGLAGRALGIFGGNASDAGSKADGASGKVKTLTDRLFGVPDVDPTITVHDFATPVVKGVKAGLVALDRYKAVPTVVVDDNTEATLSRIQNKLRELNGKKVQVFVEGVQTGTTFYHGYSSGGAVFGPGPKGVDSKLAMLAPGEHILTAREVDAAGGHQAVMAFRRSLLSQSSYAPSVATAGGGGGGGWSSAGRGIDAQTLRQALSGMTLVIDDRTGRSAQLIARGG